MDNRPTLEEQVSKAEDRDKKIYTKKILRLIEGEITPELGKELFDGSRFTMRDVERLLEEITGDYNNGCPTKEKHIRKSENAPAFAFLIGRNLVEVQEQPYFLGLFKRNIIIPKYITISDSDDIEKYKNYF